MRYRSQIIRVTLWLALLGLLFPRGAYAYIDLGTGSYIIQMAIAGALGSLFALKMYWGRLTTFLRGLFSRQKKDERAPEKQ